MGKGKGRSGTCKARDVCTRSIPPSYPVGVRVYIETNVKINKREKRKTGGDDGVSYRENTSDSLNKQLT